MNYNDLLKQSDKNLGIVNNGVGYNNPTAPSTNNTLPTFSTNQLAYLINPNYDTKLAATGIGTPYANPNAVGIDTGNNVNVNDNNISNTSSSYSIDPTILQGILDEIAGLSSGLDKAKASNQTSYNSTLANYNADQAAQEAKKTESLNANDLAYLASQQTSLVNSAKLRQALLGQLIGIGALNGSGVTQANSTIGGALQTDLTGANTNYETNANNILTAMDTYNRQNESRKKSLEQTLNNANTAAENSYATNKQDYLKQLAGLYPTGSSQGAEYLRQALALGPQIQETSNVPQYDFTPITSASFNAPELAKYLSGTNQLSVSGNNSNADVGTFYTTNRRRINSGV